MKKKINTENNLPEYDFLGSIYKNTKSHELLETFESIRDQTKKPKNIFLVIDGDIEKGVDDLVNFYMNLLPIKKIPLKKNVGLGKALRIGLQKCESKFVLRFDTDDINLKNRAECIVKELNRGDIDIVGSNFYEFVNNPNISFAKKVMPYTHNSIKSRIIFRNPINHPTVGFLKDSILKLNGGYRHFPFYEDYDLWIRALFNGLKFKNIDKELVAVRITDQRSRRTGLKLIKSEIRLLVTFFENSFFHGILFIPVLFCRILFALLPLNLVNFFFTNFFREKIKKYKS
tara:strand:+ start:758 stop:1618 length:861 start_codon:yes stop_codon:yes gene_type:complete